MRPSHQRSSKSVRSVSAVSTSSAENGSSIKQHFRIDDKPPCEADALAHAAGQLLGIGGFEPIKADKVDGLQGALAPLLLRQALRFEAQLHILEHRKPWKKREGLEDHGDAVGGSYDRAGRR